MKKTQFYFGRIAGLLTVCFVALGLSSSAQENKTVTGEVLDMHCYLAMDAHGEGHKSCAAKCINGGSPMGVLTADGKVYLLLEDNDKSAPYEEAKKHVKKIWLKILD